MSVSPSSPPATPPPSPDASLTARPRMSPALVVVFVSLFLGIQPVTTDVYLPTLPSLTQALNAQISQTQLTLSALMLAFGVGQLVLGPLSDRLGRRPVLLIGMAAYTLAALATVLAPSIETLIAARAAQGVALGAAVMVARAMVRDLYLPAEGARIMSRGLTWLGVTACACAPVGGLVSDLWGWRATLLVPTLFGATTFVLVLLRFLETAPQLDPHALQPSRLLRTWGGIVSNPTFLGFTALTSASYALLFTFLASSSFVFIDVLGLSKSGYGLVMLWNSLAYLAGTVLCRRWLPRLGVRGALIRAGGLSLTGGLLVGGLALAGIQSVPAIMLPLTLAMLAHGIHQPCGQTAAVGPFPHAAGAASALNGFAQMVLSSLVGLWLGSALKDSSTKPLGMGVALWGVVLAVLCWTVVRRYASPPVSPSVPPATGTHAA